MRTHNVLRRPRARRVQRAHRHLVDAQGVRTVITHHVIRRHGVLQGLAHLAVLAVDFLAVVVELAVLLLNLGGRDVDAAGIRKRVGLDVALVEQAAVRLLGGNKAQVIEHLVPETCVEQVQHGVLDAAHVQVHATRVILAARAGPVLLIFNVDKLIRVRRIDVSQLVPGGTGPLRHHVRVTTVLLLTMAQIHGHVHPVRGLGQRGRRLRILVVRVEGHRLVVLNLRQLYRQLVLRNAVGLAVFVIHNREGLAPVALAGKQPVAQLVLDFFGAFLLIDEPRNRLVNALLLAQAVEIKAVLVSGVDVRGVAHKRFLGNVGVQHRDNRQAEDGGELIVALIVRRHRHNRARAVAGEYVVRNEDRHLLTVDRVRGVRAGEHAGLFLILLALKVALCGNGVQVRADCLTRGWLAVGPAGVDAVGVSVGG